MNGREGGRVQGARTPDCISSGPAAWTAWLVWKTVALVCENSLTCDAGGDGPDAIAGKPAPTICSRSHAYTNRLQRS